MESNIKEGKTAAIISYILIVGPLIALSINSENKNSFASFHIRQGLGITLTFITLGLTISHFESLMIAIPLWIFISILSIYGLFTAAIGEAKPIPLLGNFFQKWLKMI
jgi:uncharacterized membrane protein